jgi:hypothetical protein
MSSPTGEGVGGGGGGGVGGGGDGDSVGGGADGEESWGSITLAAVAQWWSDQQLATEPGMWEQAASTISRAGGHDDPLVASTEVWNSFRDVLPSAAFSVLKQDWGSVLEVNCTTKGCLGSHRATGSVLQLQGGQDPADVGTNEDNVLVVCSGCERPVAARLVTLGITQLLLIHDSTVTWSDGAVVRVGRQQGRVLAPLLAPRSSGTRGAVIASVQPVPQEVQRRMRFRAWVHRRLPANLTGTEQAIRVYFCQNEACVVGQRHAVDRNCVVRTAYSLPPALVGLIRLLRLTRI